MEAVGALRVRKGVLESYTDVLTPAALDDLAFFDDEDLVGAANRRKAVGDDEGGAAAA